MFGGKACFAYLSRMNYIRFIKANATLLFFGALMTFVSGFGQTFLFSLFLPQFQDTFSMTSGSFGTFYSVITLGSAVLLPWSGALIDRFSLRSYAIGVAVMIGLSALLISVSHSLIPLFIGMLGVRHGGQGLMSHTSQTTMARYFDHVRGKALSISSLGHPLGEAVLPVTVAFMIGLIGWRMSWTAIGIFVLAVGLLLIPFLLTRARAVETFKNGGTDSEESSGAEEEKETRSTRSAPSWTRAQMLRDPRFYFIIPAGLASPFLMTGFFLYQVPLAEFKGWSVEWMASCFIGFAAAKTGFSLFSGPVIDRLTAQRVYPFMLLPLTAGLAVLAAGTHPLTALIYMLLLGTTEGISVNTKTALFAELYGVEHLGAIRSTLVAMMVLSTSIAPVLFGNLLDAGVSFNSIIYGTLIFLGLAMFLSLRILPALNTGKHQ